MLEGDVVKGNTFDKKNILVLIGNM